jgi:hypothetical protein
MVRMLKMRWRDVRWPSPGTAGEIVKRHGLVAPQIACTRAKTLASNLRPAPPRPIQTRQRRL